MKKITNQQTNSMLVSAIKHLLRPLVKLMIHYQLTFPYVRELIKEIYVDVAAEMIEKDEQELNNSRLYILTGVHRKDIKRIREQDSTGTETDLNQSLGAALIARWTAQDDYLDENGNPRQLLKTGTDQEPGFNHLVESISKDIRPRAMLDEWLRQGIISTQGNSVTLNQAAFVPAQNFDELCYFFDHHLHDHIATSTHNLLAKNEPMLERSVYYAHLSSESIEKLKQSSQAQAMELLGKINKQAQALHHLDQSNPQATLRFRLGCYWYQQDKKS
jgi:hypothetical protein